MVAGIGFVNNQVNNCTFQLLPLDDTKINKFINQTKKVQKSPGVILGAHYKPAEKFYPICTAILGDFESGTTEVTRVHSVSDFIENFGLINTVDSLSCISYLKQAPNLLVKRVIGYNSTNASMEGFDPIKITSIKELEECNNFLPEDSFVRFVAQHPGRYGNYIKIAMLTLEDYNNNSEIIPGLFTKDVFGRIPELNYGIVIFFKDKIKETFTIPFNQLSLLSYVSKYVYCGSRLIINIINIFDGLKDIYDGNIGYFTGGDDLYDGKFSYHDGNLFFIDGNEKKNLFNIPRFFGDNIIQLSNGFTEKPTLLDFKEACEDFENPDNYDIDLCIANNYPIIRKDIVNIVSCPNGIDNAIDFINVYNTNFENLSKFNNFMFIYGTKKINNLRVPLSGDYCGNRVKTLLNEGLGVSTSKISKPLPLENLIHNPPLSDREKLYEYSINAIVNENGKYYCNGEIIYKDKK